MISKRTLITFLFGAYTKLENNTEGAWLNFTDINGKSYLVDSRDGILFSTFRKLAEINEIMRKIEAINTSLSAEISQLKLKLEEKSKK